MKITVIGGTQAHQSIRDDGICPCLTSSMGMGGGYVPLLIIREQENRNMQKQYEVCDFRFDEGLRSRVEKDIVPTLPSHMSKMENDYSCMVIEKENKDCVAYDEQNKYIRQDGTVGTLTTNGSSPKHNNRIIEKDTDFRIRKLTPRECWRLMGFTDEDFDRAKEVNSDSQLYKQAGNSIVVDVLCAIFKEML